MEHRVKILMTEFVTHDVKRFIVEKPQNYSFTPGQATDVSINKKWLRGEKRPFTFTSLNQDEVLEFTIKNYSDHDGVTKKIHQLKAGDELLINDPWGTINYKDKGVFIAGGAGITPFIAIFRDLHQKGKLTGNKLIFSNKAEEDIILQKELENMFESNDLLLTLTQEKNPKYLNERVDKNFLEKYIVNFKQDFYLCGPPPMVKSLKEILTDLGANVDQIVFEK
ncbi:MAG: flavodoxin reductase [Candidatus Buchananbacteria bacterium RIFCSPHIGHO2_02_FULL_38_8]|uniref:Flavodoxin reductase n=2 Tax=Candidatus Buchananiibacteriota TaxID=1817903 RepID=A0A1G1XUS7_9BACT|nr:MAG: flavodoxin reductase [Candidatus Buchananbacteria bacterium RIFCSPHIGHO2_01_FULL_39_8]OGY47181.1 MAG: flavodoxin reductase [Candidatus Buchananbacteria bacterium RIFCSPHIGHO2_02_FULL_38_8]